jgi:uncharacterized protein with NRDE domain
MCLLVALSRVHPEAALVVAANRDEWLARPARAMEVLRDGAPRILGGRDLTAGGTWLAVNEHGVVAGLTNQPQPGGRDPAKRSRGELPLVLARHRRADEAAAAFAREVVAAEYNPCWILVGDRDALFYLELGGGPVRAVRLPPGVHVLENRPLEAPSPKVALVRELLAGCEGWRGEALFAGLHAVLRSHLIPDGAREAPRDATKPLEAESPCVHAGPYGTRSSEIVVVAGGAPPAVRFTDGPSCTTPLRDATPLWQAEPPGA